MERLTRYRMVAAWLGVVGGGVGCCFGQIGAPPPTAAARVATLTQAGMNAPCNISVCDAVSTFGVDPALNTACLEVRFPDVSWRIGMEIKPLKALWIGPVEIKKPGETTWTRVIKEAGLVDIFVRYDEGAPECGDACGASFPCQPGRCYDMNPFSSMDEIGPADVGPNGFSIAARGMTQRLIGVECRERGLAWLCKRPLRGVDRRYRGKEVAVWGVTDSGNYDAVIQYVFRDDGELEFRYGAAGYNGCTPTTAHMHVGLWRVDVDVAGPADDCAMESFREDPSTVSPCPDAQIARELEEPFNGGVEGSLDVDPYKFTALSIEDLVLVNRWGHAPGFEFIPFIEGGQPRHLGSREQWTLHNFYVTRYKATETGYTSPDNWQQREINPDDYLVSQYIADQELVCGDDLVVWCVAGALHTPSDEDRRSTDTATTFDGVTLIHWSGFNMHPHNFFDHNPLGDPSHQP